MKDAMLCAITWPAAASKLQFTIQFLRTFPKHTQITRSRAAVYSELRELARTIVSLPMNPHLQPEQARSVSRAILDFAD